MLGVAVSMMFAAGAAPDLSGAYGVMPKLAETYDVVLRPDKDEAEWWAGAPSVMRGKDGIFWMACRMRTADAPRGLRGYEIRILRSTDGAKFEKAASILREQVPIPGFERPALLSDPVTGKCKLYACGPWKEGPWSIIKFDDADTPEDFNPASAHPVISPCAKAYERDVPPEEYKDPVVIHACGAYHAWVIGYLRRLERVYHFTSPDGEQWTPAGDPRESVMNPAGWHDFFVRPAAVVPAGLGYFFIYEGSKTTWHDPVYNVLTGLGFTFDLNRIIDLTPEKPLFESTTPNADFHTWRYSSWLRVDNELWAYAEVAAPNGTHEIRRFRFPVE